MKQLDALSYLKLNKWNKFLYNLKLFFCSIPRWFANLGKKIWHALKKFGIAIWENILDIGKTFKNGRLPTKLSFLIMGLGNICYGQALRGILFLLFEIVFIAYMCIPGSGGAYWLSKFGTLGTVEATNGYDEKLDVYTTIPGDSSFKILLYGLMTIIFIIAFIYTWRLNLHQCRICDELKLSGKRPKSSKEDLKSLLDEQFHKTLLALPTIGIVMFTVIPIIFMILVAFTSYDGQHSGDGYGNLFTWVGLDNFNTLFGVKTENGDMAIAFGEVLSWTLIWAFFATFTNYFLGMFVAMMINKKGIRFKKWWRTALVLTIAIPQFISLLYVTNMFSSGGVIANWLYKLGLVSSTNIHIMDSQSDPNLARVMVILINIWIGIPYLMLITTGILMNIPADLYESAKIDGASGWKQFTKITLPYMLFVTGPYLLTSFTSNLNNFNVIYLLTGGMPSKTLTTGTGSVGDTDILITWLYNITTGESSAYNMACVIGIMIFIVVSVISMVVYNLLPSNKNEEDFS